jgi:cytoskeletal protein RodZ
MGVRLKMKVKKTTLLVIVAILLWGAVAIWNEVQRSDSGDSSMKATNVHSTGSGSKDNQTTNPSTKRVNIATH